MNNFVTISKQAPTKTEIKSFVLGLNDLKEYSDIEKFIWGKVLEITAKELISEFQPKAIKSFLEMSEGSVNETVLGVDVKIVKESIIKTLEKYTYSDNVTAIENEITIEQTELKLLNEKLKTEKQLEINHGIAKLEIFEETSEPNLSIRVTLKK